MCGCVFGVSQGGGKVTCLVFNHLGEVLDVTFLNGNYLLLRATQAFLLSEQPHLNLAKHHSI